MSEQEGERRDLSAPEVADPVSGEGDEPYLTPVQANKLIAMVLNKRRRIPFDSKVLKFAVQKTVSNIKNSDGRVSNAAVSNLLKMEQMNQQDDHKALDAAMSVMHPKKQQNVNLTVNGDAAVQLYLPDNGRVAPDVSDRVTVIDSEKTTADG